MDTNWISVIDGQPETWSLFGGCSNEVYVHYVRKAYDGTDLDVYTTGVYCGGHRWRALWCGQGGTYRYRDVKVDFWQPIQRVPKGGKK